MTANRFFSPRRGSARPSRSRRSALLALLCGLVLLVPSLAAAQDAILEVIAPVEGALIFLDGEPIGESPLLEIVPAGKHMLTISAEGFRDFEHVILLEPDTETTVNARMVRSGSAIEVKVDLSAARVFLDGEEIGGGELVREEGLKPGPHELKVVADGYPEWTGKVTLKEGARTPVTVSLAATLGRLALSGSPSGATVRMDGEQRGQLPLVLEALRPGSHGLRFQHDGYSEVLQSIAVEAGGTAEVQIELVKEGGSIEVKPSIEDATVHINGVLVGEGQLTVGPLKPGLYSLKVSAPNHTDVIRRIAVKADETNSQVVKLRHFDDSTRTARGNNGGSSVAKKPGLWAALGGGAGAVIAGVIIAVAVSKSGPDDQPAGVTPPKTDLGFALP